METIQKSHNSIDFNNLTNHYKGPNVNTDFNKFIDTATLFDETKQNKTIFADADKNQMDFESKLGDIRTGGKKSNKQKSEIENITIFMMHKKRSFNFLKNSPQ